MTKDDMKDFIEILDYMAEGLDTNMTAVKYKFYFAALSDLNLDDIKKAANHIARTATFFPKPVDFRNAINGDIDTAVAMAWEKILKAKSKAGKYQSVQFDDFVVHSVIKLMGGWDAVCSLEGYDSEKWQKIEFEKTYKATQGQNIDHPNYLPGLTEKQQGDWGPEFKKPVMMITGQTERKALPPTQKESLPEPERILSQKEVSKRIKVLCGNIKTVEDGPLDEDMPCTIE